MKYTGKKFVLSLTLLTTSLAGQVIGQEGQTMTRWVNEYLYFPGVTRMSESNDAPCRRRLPLLCFKDDHRPVPESIYPEINPNWCLFSAASKFCKGMTAPRHVLHDWSEGVIQPTERLSGNSFAHILDANAYCAQKFGPGWRVAKRGEGSALINWWGDFSAYDLKDGGRYPDGRLSRSPHLGIGRTFWVGKGEPTDNVCWSEN